MPQPSHEDSIDFGSLLAISVGNTNTAVGAFIAGDIIERISVPNSSPDAVASAAEKLADDHAIDIAVLATVNRKFSAALTSRLENSGDLRLLHIAEDCAIPLKHRLDDEAILKTGQDRLLNAVAAHRIARQACVVVDA
ncbi:MAG: type III pantothenate kinase, partial [Phycisphaerales bacterium]